ncbi:MAG TPA: hypothetical protein VND54_02740 [Candidatus Saccharimonadales bacterium]|nr:hypothetical protein [Candidatus Saccharimonadales bacterium]
MSGDWIAGGVRARGLAAADLDDMAERVALTADLDAARAALGQTKWGLHLAEVTTVGAAQRKIFEALLWQLRILAGWLPSEGVESVRSCVMWFELRNIEDRLAFFAGAPAETPYELGRLGIISRGLGGTGSASEIRRLMRPSAWGDPGGEDLYTIRISMRRAWYRRARLAAPELRVWADAAALLFGRRERLAHRTGGDALEPAPISLPADWKWASATPWSVEDLWQAEARWWEQVREDGRRLSHGVIGSTGPVIGTIAILASSAHRIATALEIASGGGSTEPIDAVR